MTATTLENLDISVDPAWEALAGNETAAAIYQGQQELSVLNPDSSERQSRFYEVVEVTPLLPVPREALPADLQDSAYDVMVKYEGAQHGGAYKLRGTTNRLLDEPTDKIVGAASTGNHANTTALAANALGFAGVEIDCPYDTVYPKKKAMNDNGAVVHDAHVTLPDAMHAARDRSKARGGIFVHPYDDLKVITGQGTITLESIAQLQDLGYKEAPVTFLFPGGGGGIGAGNAVAAKANWQHAEVRISQMEGAHGIAAELAGQPLDPAELDKSCDGAAVPVPGRLAMNVIRDPALVDAVDVVSKADVGEAMAVLARIHRVPEPAGALAMAATLRYMRHHRDRHDLGRRQVLVAVTSGIQVTPQKVTEFMRAAYAAGRVDGPTAFTTVSQAHDERSVHGLDEIRTSAPSASAKIGQLMLGGATSSIEDYRAEPERPAGYQPAMVDPGAIDDYYLQLEEMGIVLSAASRQHG